YTVVLSDLNHTTMHSHHQLFFFTVPATPDIYTLSLHDALPIFVVLVSSVSKHGGSSFFAFNLAAAFALDQHKTALYVDCNPYSRSEEHTSELQSRENLVCRLLLEKKKRITQLSH